MTNQFKTILAYRGFIWGSLKRDFQMRYRKSVLGSLWAILNPLATILIYTVIFSQLMKARLPGINDTMAYSIYLCSGVLTWSFFSEIIQRSQNVFLENANLIKKLNFPRICLPIIVVGNAAVSFSISFGLFLVFLIFLGKFPGWIVLAFPVVCAIQAVFAIGFGIILGIGNVFFRDIGQGSGILMQFWFWFTPIIYPISILPEAIRSLVLLNPMVSVVSAYQSILVYGNQPDWLSLASTALLAVLVCFLAFHFYKKRSGEMVDEL